MECHGKPPGLFSYSCRSGKIAVQRPSDAEDAVSGRGKGCCGSEVLGLFGLNGIGQDHVLHLYRAGSLATANLSQAAPFTMALYVRGSQFILRLYIDSHRGSGKNTVDLAVSSLNRQAYFLQDVYSTLMDKAIKIYAFYIIHGKVRR